MVTTATGGGGGGGGGGVRAHISAAFAAAPGVDLTVPELQRIPLPARLSVRAPGTAASDRPVVVLEDGTPLTAAVVAALADQGHCVVVVGVKGVSRSGGSSGVAIAAGGRVTYAELAGVGEDAVKDFVQRGVCCCWG